MEIELYFKSILGLCFIIGLIFICAYLAKKYGINNKLNTTNNRLKIISYKSIDVKNKLVLAKKDNLEILLLVSPTSVQVLDKTTVENLNKDKNGDFICSK